MDYYNVLGVDKTATAKEIKTAYRKKARELHPDVNKSKDAEEKFKELSEAYSVLGDEESRAKYDNPQSVPNFGFGGAGGFPGFGGFDNIGDFLNSNFQREDPNAPRRGSSVRINRTIDLYDALFGMSLNSKVKFKDTCTRCKGSGGLGVGDACSFCSGSGHITETKGNMRMSQMCSSCSGRGYQFSTRCVECDGGGTVPFSRDVNIDLPAGFAGGVLTLHGQGGEGLNDGPPGDLLLNVSVNLPKLDKEKMTEEELNLFKKYLSEQG